jgi:phosphoserine aminotransferase
MAEKTKNNFKSLLSIPHNYHCWFCSGGIHLQFAGIPMNYAGHSGNVVANYTATGWFSKLALNEGKKILKAHCIAEIQKDDYGRFTLPDEFNYAENAAFTHFVDNETVEGVEYPDGKFPYQPGVPLFDDCTSSFLTKPIDWTKVSLAFAHAQKNCGIAGSSIMIVNDSLLKTNPSVYLP